MGKYTEEQEAAMIAMYTAGVQAKRIAEALELPNTGCIYNALTKAGITNRQFENISESVKRYRSTKNDYEKEQEEDIKKQIEEIRSSWSKETVWDYLKCCDAHEMAGWFELVKHWYFCKGQASKLGEEYRGYKNASFDDVERCEWFFTEDFLSSPLDSLINTMDMAESDIANMHDKIQRYLGETQ